MFLAGHGGGGGGGGAAAAATASGWQSQAGVGGYPLAYNATTPSGGITYFQPPQPVVPPAAAVTGNPYAQTAAAVNGTANGYGGYVAPVPYTQGVTGVGVGVNPAAAMQYWT